MIVTVVCDVLGKPNNGTTIAALHLIETLQKAGDEVRIVCPDEEHQGEDRYFVLPKFNFGVFQPIFDHNGVCLAKPVVKTLREALSGAGEVHIMMPFFAGVKAARLCKELGIPVSAGFHVQAENVTAHFNVLLHMKHVNRAVYKWMWKHFYRYIDTIHYPTQFIRDVFETAIGRKTPGVVISNGVSSDFKPIESPRPAEWEKKFIVVMTGRYSKEKNQKLLIKAISLSKHKKDIQLILAGSGPRINELKKCAKRHKIEPHFRFYTHPELIKALSMADLYVHASRVEIEAISCLEAIACGLTPLINNSPLSATKSFALSEKNLFKEDDRKDLARKIDYWYEHPEEREENRKLYAAYVGQFDFDMCMEKMVKMVHDTANAKVPSL